MERDIRAESEKHQLLERIAKLEERVAKLELAQQQNTVSEPTSPRL